MNERLLQTLSYMEKAGSDKPMTVAQARRALLAGGISAFLVACGIKAGVDPIDETPAPTADFNPTATAENPNAALPTLEPLYPKDVDVLFIGHEAEYEELGIQKEDVMGGYFKGTYLFAFEDKNGADYIYMNQGTSFEPLDWGVDGKGNSYFGPKTNVGKPVSEIKAYFLWNPNVMDNDGNIIFTYQSDGTEATAQQFVLPTENNFHTKISNAKFVAPTIAPTEAPVEVEKYQVCETMNWRNCPLSLEDLNGPYQEWLEKEFAEPFDPSKIQGDLPLANYGPFVYYPSNTAPHFTGENEGTEPFDRDLTIGYVEYKDEQGRDWLSIIMPLKVYDPNNPSKPQFIQTAHSFPMWWYKYTDEDINKVLKTWKEEMNITPILTDTLDVYSKTEDPLVANSFKKYPDIQDRFDRLAGYNSYDVSKQDMTALSAPGIIVHNKITRVTNGKNPYQ